MLIMMDVGGEEKRQGAKSTDRITDEGPPTDLAEREPPNQEQQGDIFAPGSANRRIRHGDHGNPACWTARSVKASPISA